MEARVYLQTIGFALLGILATIGNSLVCIAIWRMKQRRSIGHYFIASLTMSDLYFGMFIMPMSVVELHAGATVTTTTFWCKGTAGLALVAILGTSWNLVLVSIDRFVAIVKPFSYQVWFTQKSVSIAIACLWLMVIIWAFLPLMGWATNIDYQRAALTLCIWPLILDKTYFTITLILVFIAVSIVAILQSVIFVFARKQAKQIHDNTSAFQTERSKIEYEKRQRKITKIIGIIVGFFIMTYLPWMGILARNIWANVPANQIGILVGLLLVYINSAANPWIYTLSDRRILREVKKFLPCFKDTEEVADTSCTSQPNTRKNTHQFSDNVIME